MLRLLAPSRHKNGGHNERSFLVDQHTVDVGAIKGFYFLIFQPQLVVVLNVKKRNGAKHGLLHWLPCCCWNKKKVVNGVSVEVGSRAVHS
jgi:hypothetical protein